MQYQRCTRCVMDNASDKSITFNDKGQCNYCCDVISRMPTEYFPTPEGKQKLDAIMAKIKEDGKGKKYDCIVGVSGGLDSSYIIYLGYQYGLRMLAVHIDDGLDTEISKSNIKNLCAKANVDLKIVRPDKEQYADLLLALFKASVPNLALAQDNILKRELFLFTKENNLTYSLSGANFAHECILERFDGVNASDKTAIVGIHKRFGTKPIDKLNFCTLWSAYIGDRYFSPVKKVLPLNYIDYNKERVLKELAEFSGYNYYGGKHYESILTRFLQCYYLPVKYGFDKRKSHFSSLIVNGQMKRDEAIEILQHPSYISEELKEYDMNFLANYMGITRKEFDQILELPPKKHSDYPTHWLNKLAPVARKFRKYLG